MKKLYKIVPVVLLLVSFLQMNAQKDIVFGLDKEYTKRHIGLNRDNPFVYSVVQKKIVIEQKSSVKKKSEAYEKLEAEISDLENSMTGLNKNYEEDLNRYNGLKKATKNIKLFLSSQKPIEASREVLIRAQEMVSSFGMDELIYADGIVNSENKLKFSLLALNYTNFRLHLKETVSRIEGAIVEPTNHSNEQELAEKKSQLDSLDAYVVVKGPTKKRTKLALATGNKVNSIHTELVGEFVVTGSYLVMKRDYNSEFKKGRLISYGVARKKGFIKKGYVSAQGKSVIKSTSSNRTYIVDKDFLKKYAFTFNGKYRYQAKNLISLL